MARMTYVFGATLLISTPAAIAPAQQPAAQTAEAVLSGTTGDSVFKTYCGSCHGKSARGDGPLADSLRLRPPDLTRIAKRNGGKFDAENVHRIIDGRKVVKGHGGTDMPVWGDAFRQSAESDSEDAVKARIKGIVQYLESLQVK
jgi:mono/diheme cytochrome c family protein